MDPAVVLETSQLTKRFGGVTAVAGVDFRLLQGELRCLIGPNGAGKTTFFKMLSGQLRPSGGSVALRGLDITGREPHEIGGLGLGVKTQVPSLFNGLSVRENLYLAARRRNAPARATSSVEESLVQIGMTAKSERRAGDLAHGERQWVELAMVMLSDPEVLLLDEPAAGMSPDEVARTADLLGNMRGRRSIVVVDHDMHFVRMIAETVTVFHQGRVLVEGLMEEISRDPRVRDVYLGKQIPDHA